LIYGNNTRSGPFRAIRWDALAAIGMEDTNFAGRANAGQGGAPRAEITEVGLYRRRVGVFKIVNSRAIRAGYKIL
jgi:hypothetical protein